MHEILRNSGQVGRDLLTVDWDATSIGPPETWPGSLRTAVRTVLGSRFSMWMAWGPDLVFFCNDAYRRDTLGAKYPWALGRPAPEVWSEVWPDVAARVERVLTHGEATWDERLQLFLERNGYREETYHTFSYSPLTDDAGAVAGLLCVVAEVTEEVVAQRRMATLRDLAVRETVRPTQDETLVAVSRVLSGNTADLPFHLVYLYDEHCGTRLAATGGHAPGRPAAPVDLPDGVAPPWPIPEGDEPVVVDLAAPVAGAAPPAGPWGSLPAQAAVVPVNGSRGTPYGFLVAGLNPCRPFDDGYADFLGLVCSGIAAAVAGTRELEVSRELLDQAQRLARIGSWSLELPSGRLETSPELLRILDRSHEELAAAGHPGFLADFTHPDDREFVAAVLGEAAPGEEIAYEVRMLRPDGSDLHAGVRAEMVPLGAGAVLRGSLQDVTERRRTAESLASAHATAVAAAREHQIAAELQRSLLPQRIFDLKHLEVATFYRPGAEGTEVGGDWYDVIELSHGRTALVMGDVMGHGVPAAAVMGQIRTAVRAYARLGLPPKALMESLDALVWDLFPDQIVTCLYAEFDPDGLTLRLLNAGHVPPLLVDAASGGARLETEPHPPLGLGRPFVDPPVLRLQPGSGLLLYTDGLVERRGRDIDAGIAELERAAGRLRLPLEELPEAVVRTLVDGAPEDDVAVLVARVATLAASR